MSIQNLIIYKFIPLYNILEELNLDFNFNISLIEDENSLNRETKNYNNYLLAKKAGVNFLAYRCNISSKKIFIDKKIKIIND